MTFPIPTHRYFHRNKSVLFDGTNDYMARGADLTGIVDGKVGTLSCWIKLNAGDGTSMVVFTGNRATTTGRIILDRTTANRFAIRARNAAGTSIMLFQTSSTTQIADGTFHHLLASWDLAAGTLLLYMNDASDITITTNTNDTIDYTDGNYFVGADNAAGAKLNAYLASLWFNPTFLDITTTANRRKFIDGSGKPVNLGATGELPLGSQPILYQTVKIGDVATDFATNRGTGGNFTITGTLDLATGPSG